MSGSHRNELNKAVSGAAPKERLIALKEAAQILELSEGEVGDFVAAGKIPAYKIGGQFLRFKKDQMEALRGRVKILKLQSVPIEKISPLSADTDEEESVEKSGYTFFERVRDFIYFNDFYILALILIALLIFIILNKK